MGKRQQYNIIRKNKRFEPTPDLDRLWDNLNVLWDTPFNQSPCPAQAFQESRPTITQPDQKDTSE